MADRLRSAFAQVEYERDRVEVLLNDLSEGVVGVSAEGKVTIANPAAAILLDAPMAVGATIDEAFPADVAQLWRDSQQDADFDMVVFAHDDVTLEATTYPVGGDADFTSIVVLRDVTAQARLERARRDLIANASHEFKTPLFSLAGSLELIDEGELSPEEQSEFLQIMRQQVDRLRDHGGQHARPLAGRGGLVRAQPGGRGPRRHRPLGAGRVPGAGADQAGGALVRGRGRPDGVVRRAAPGPGAARADRQRHQVLARRAARCGSTSQLEEQEAVMVVADDGPGISGKELPHVFERFHRGREERGTTTGAGLGLSIARELTEMMGGGITAESPPDGGARFTVRLPRTAGVRRRTRTAS